MAKKPGIPKTMLKTLKKSVMPIGKVTPLPKILPGSPSPQMKKNEELARREMLAKQKFPASAPKKRIY